MQVLSRINYIIAVIFTICFSYQFFYIPVVWFFRRRKKTHSEPMLHSFAVLIAARNEETVIGDLIRSVRAQTYPEDHVKIFVMADNCTDRTAETAEKEGVSVYIRNDTEHVGKGYALDALFSCIERDHPEGFDGYMIFDADNILAPDYIENMNRTFSGGADIVTSYRNSKNYGSSWISAGYALWFLRESRYLNLARSILGSSCAVSGTGFLMSRSVVDSIGGWPFHLLTEDIEFSIDQITKGRKIDFCAEAELYDEQPEGLRQSFRQRLRWSRGYLQVFGKYGWQLIRGILRGSFSCFDMTMTIMPAFILSTASIVINVIMGIAGACAGDDVMIAVRSFMETFGNAYLLLFGLGTVTAVTEWRHIHAAILKKLFYLLTFPLFMFTYIPIAFMSFFVRPGWKPIRHTMNTDRMSDEERNAMGISFPQNRSQGPGLSPGPCSRDN